MIVILKLAYMSSSAFCSADSLSGMHRSTDQNVGQSKVSGVSDVALTVNPHVPTKHGPREPSQHIRSPSRMRRKSERSAGSSSSTAVGGGDDNR
jgi:hypothetical protein